MSLKTFDAHCGWWIREYQLASRQSSREPPMFETTHNERVLSLSPVPCRHAVAPFCVDGEATDRLAKS
jgi:hypothetical protein